MAARDRSGKPGRSIERFKFACTLEKSVELFEKIEFDYDDEHAHGESQCMHN